MRRSIAILSIFLLLSCGKKEPAKKYISAVSLIEQQVKGIDTSLYSIKRYNSLDTLPPDTAYVHRDDFRKEVAVFFKIPDLSDPKTAKKFQEETRYDELMNRVIISYTPIDEEKEAYKRIELFVEPNLATGDQVKTILVTRREADRNGFEQEDLVWQMDRSCTQIRTTRLPGEAEHTRTTKWSWKE